MFDFFFMHGLSEKLMIHNRSLIHFGVALYKLIGSIFLKELHYILRFGAYLLAYLATLLEVLSDCKSLTAPVVGRVDFFLLGLININ